ncbi:MAG: response regulator [Magnetococcales bacterium]|nr:response regulator [Magnetococcales bacterium]MBF0419317.1 response regulator [Magnetococcales bacterium]
MSTTTSKAKIVIAEDSPGNIKMLVEMLAAEYEIAIATDGLEALEVVTQFQPDVLLLDIEMPHLNGFDVCMRLKAKDETQDIPIIFLTARDSTHDEAMGLAHGAIDYITKPFNPFAVMARVNNQVLIKKQREELQRITAQLREVNQYKSEFIANMSHEIRTPMNAIIGLSDLALRMELPPKVRDYLGKISHSSQSLLRIINDILDFSKIDAGKLELEQAPFLLRDAFDHLADMFRIQTTEKHIELILCYSDECRYELIGDVLRLEQILMNLVGNALKFTEEGEIEVQVTTLQEAPTRVDLQFTVRDTGIGMSESALEMLFQAFSQADSSVTRRYGGTGLGLSISKKLVGLMGGTIGVSSTPGQGSAFRFTIGFDRIIGDMDKDLSIPDEMERLKALVVDDNATARRAMEKVLAMFGLAPTVVGSGKEAVAAFQQAIAENTPFQLVLLDWLMPEMDGIQTAQHLKEHNIPDSPYQTLLLGPYDREEQLRSQGKAVGVTDYLSKPVNCSILFDKIMNTFGRQATKTIRRSKKTIHAADVMAKIGGAQVLLVEDNAINRQVAMELLQEVGCVTETAQDGREAVIKVTRNMYDIVLMDIQMPVMDGYQATRRIRELPGKDSLPIVAMTAHAMTGDRQKSLQAGMDDHITKPIDRRQLYSTLVKRIAPRDGLGMVPPPVKPEMPGNDGLDFPPSLPGLDCKAALERLSGNRRVYRSLLTEFHKDYAQAARQVRDGLLSKQEEKTLAVTRLIHTIKGIAGNISAHRLYNAALTLEKEIAGSQDHMPSGMDSFEEAMSEVLETISRLQREEQRKTNHDSSDVTPIATMNRDAVFPMMRTLSREIGLGAVETQDTFDALKPYLMRGNKGVQEAVKQLEEQIDRIDFSKASATLSALAKALDMDLGNDKS